MNNYWLIIIVFVHITCIDKPEKEQTNTWVFDSKLQLESIKPGTHEIKIGDSFEISFSSGSCCANCWTENDYFKKIRYVTTTTELKIDKDTDGGQSYYLKKYTAISLGVDTIRHHSFARTEHCDLFSDQAEIYIIKVVK